MTPLQEPTFLVLAALAGEPLHGYGIIQAVAQLSEGRTNLRPGTLYPALDRLASDGLVELAHEEIVDGRLRRYYRLTDVGAVRLAAEAHRHARNAEAAQTRLAARSATLPAVPIDAEPPTTPPSRPTATRRPRPHVAPA